MFGTLQTWNTAGITLLSVIIFAYILAINFSYKRGFKNIQFWFEFGLIVAGITRFINPSLVVPDIDFLLVLLVPVFIFRLFNVDSLRLKFTSLILSILGVLIAATMSFLNINLADYNWGIEHALFIFNLLLVLFWGYNLYKKRKHLKKFLSKVSKGSTIEFSLPKFDYRSISALKNLIVIIFFIGSVYYLINNGFIEDTFDNFIAGFTDTIGKSNIQELFLGKGVSLETNFFLNIMDAFGIVGVGVFLISIGVVLFSEIKKLTKKFEVGRFSFVLAQSIFILTGIFFQLTTLMVFVQFTYISFSMINARTGEFDFEQYQYMSIKGIKDKRVRIFLNILKFLLILIALVGVVAVIASLTSIIGRNLR
jgi:hypothetical protein